MKQLSRLRMHFPEDCIGNVVKSVDESTFEKAGNQQHESIVGGSGEARTPDHLIKSQMLYQLSYRPAREILKGIKKAINVNCIDYA